MPTPTFTELMPKVLKTIDRHGGQATVAQIERAVTTGNRKPDMKLKYNAGWARSWLKAFGAIENPSTGVWTLGKRANEAKAMTGLEIATVVRRARKTSTRTVSANQPTISEPESPSSILRAEGHMILNLYKRGVLNHEETIRSLSMILGL